MTEHAKQIRWIAHLAQATGWTAYAKARSAELEEIWPGITAEIRAEIERQKSLNVLKKGGDCEAMHLGS
ncbi:hypothetical protein [Diaphorobacter nitroreducens]